MTAAPVGAALVPEPESYAMLLAGLGMMGLTAAAAMTGGSALKSGLASIGGGASAVMAAVSKGSQNVAAGSDILSGFGGKGSSSDGSQGSSSSGTPLSEAAGFSRGSSSGSSAGKTNHNKGDSPINSAGAVGRVAADAVANLAKGTKDMAKDKFGSMKESVLNAMAESTGGKIAAAIRQAASENEQNQTADIDTEVSAFRDGFD